MVCGLYSTSSEKVHKSNQKYPKTMYRKLHLVSTSIYIQVSQKKTLWRYMQNYAQWGKHILVWSLQIKHTYRCSLKHSQHKVDRTERLQKHHNETTCNIKSSALSKNNFCKYNKIKLHWSTEVAYVSYIVQTSLLSDLPRKK